MSHAELFEAIQANLPEAALLVLAKDAELCVEHDEPSALMQAIYRRQRDVIGAILARRRRLDVFEAAALGDVPALRRELANYKEAPIVFAADGFTALHLACFFGRPRAAELLLRSGARVSAIAGNASMLRPLHSAASSGNAEICVMLLDAGADPNATQHGGYTALHAAAARGDLPLARLLLARGARLDVAADDGRTALDIAQQAGFAAPGSTLGW